MKNKILATAAIIFFAVFLFSCRKETTTVASENNNTPESILTGKTAIAQPGVTAVAPEILFWKVGSFIINGDDVSVNFQDLKFQFQDDNTVLVTIADLTMVGKWFMTDKEHVYLFFNPYKLPVGDLNDLNGNWYIRKITAWSMFFKIDEFENQKELRLDMYRMKGGGL